MTSPNVFRVATSMVVSCAADDADAFDREGPASTPTILVEVDESPSPTALPAPPRLPSIAALHEWRLPPPSRVPVIRPALAIVSSAPRIEARPTMRAPEIRSHKLRIVRPSSPPSFPPPSPELRPAA